MAGSILGTSETTLVYWVDLELSDLYTFRSAISSHDITWNNEVYPADGKFIGLGTSVYELSTTNQPLEITVDLSQSEILYVNTRSYLRRKARVWRAHLDSNNQVVSANVQQIKNGFLDSHSDAPGQSITFTISSWLSIAQDSVNTPNSLTFSSQVLRNIGISASKATQAPSFENVGAATVAASTHTLSLGEVLPQLTEPYMDEPTRDEQDRVTLRGFNGEVPGLARAQPIEHPLRSQTDNNYQFFSNGPRRTFATFSRDLVSQLVNQEPSFGSEAAIPFSLVTEGFLIRAENPAFDGNLQSIGSGNAFLGGQKVPTFINSRWNHGAIQSRLDDNTPRAPLNIPARETNPVYLHPSRLCNPDGIYHDAASKLLLQHSFSSSFELEGVGGADTASGRIALASDGYRRIVADRATADANNLSSQRVELDQILCLGPVSEVSITSPLFTNNHNRFTASNDANAGTIRGVDIRKTGDPNAGETVTNPFNTTYPDALNIVFTRNSSGDITGATVQTHASGTTQALRANPDGSFTGDVYASVFNSYYTAVASVIGSSFDDNQNRGASGMTAPIYTWSCIDRSHRNFSFNRGYPEQLEPQFRTTSNYGAPAIHFMNLSRVGLSATADQKTRRNKVMEYTIYPGDADGGKVCWIKWTIYNRAFEAAAITTNNNDDPRVSRFAHQRGKNHTINFITNPFGEDNEQALFSFRYTITGLSEPSEILREIVTNQIGVDDDLVDTTSGTFLITDTLNTNNRNALANDSRWTASQVSSVRAIPQTLSGSLISSSYAGLLDSIFTNTGLLAVEDKSTGITETPIYMFAGIARDPSATNQGFAQDFNDRNASFQIDFGRSSEIPNTYTAAVRAIQAQSDGTSLPVEVGVALNSELLRRLDNQFVNALTERLDLLQLDIDVDDNFVTTQTDGVITPSTLADRIAYMIMSRRLGIDTLSISTDYKNAGNLRLGDFVRVEWAKFGWLGTNTTAWRIFRIDDDNRGRITLVCQRHDNLISAGFSLNTFSFQGQAGSETATSTPGSSSTTSASRAVTGTAASGGTVVTQIVDFDLTEAVTFEDNVTVQGSFRASRGNPHDIDFGGIE